MRKLLSVFCNTLLVATICISAANAAQTAKGHAPGSPPPDPWELRHAPGSPPPDPWELRIVPNPPPPDPWE